MADFQWREIDASQTLEHWTGYITDTSDGDMDLSLPPDPSDSTYLRLADGKGTWGEYPVTLDAGENTIEAAGEEDRRLVCDVSNDNLGLLFKNGRWVVVK